MIERKASEALESARYDRLLKLGAGGMATVYLGRMQRGTTFSRLVAIKRAHPWMLEDPSLKAMFVSEARLASLVRHSNVVSVQDVHVGEDELFLVMDYIEGASLAVLCELNTDAPEPLPPAIALRIVLDSLSGLHAVHTARTEEGKPLELVHRDVSPQNVLVGVDGVARIADFGIAKSVQESKLRTTGVVKGKVGYIAPEYVEHGDYDRRSDVFGMAVVAWEVLAGRRLFRTASDLHTLHTLVHRRAPLIGTVVRGLPSSVDKVLDRALAKEPETRFATADAFAEALEHAMRPMGIATHREVARLVGERCSWKLEQRRGRLAELLRSPSTVEVSIERPLEEPAPEASPEHTETASEVVTSRRPRTAWAAVFALAVVTAGALVLVMKREGEPPKPEVQEVPAAPLEPEASAPQASASAPAEPQTATSSVSGPPSRRSPSAPRSRPLPAAPSASAAGKALPSNPYGR